MHLWHTGVRFGVRFRSRGIHLFFEWIVGANWVPWTPEAYREVLKKKFSKMPEIARIKRHK